MSDHDEQDMSGMPIHVRNKARLAAEQDALITQAAEQRKAQQSQPHQPAVENVPVEQNGTQPTDEVQEVEEDNGNDDMSALKREIEELKLQLVDSDNRLKTHYGRQRKLAEVKAQEVSNLTAKIEALESQLSKTGSKTNTDEDVLRAHDWTDEDIADSTSSQIARAARECRKRDAELAEMRDKVDSINKRVSTTSVNDRMTSIDLAINATYPGFLSAIKRDGKADMEWSMFADETNPDSSENLTFGETYEQAKKLGNRDAVLQVVKKFVKAHPHLSLKDSEGENGSVDVPPLRLMPSSGPAPTVNGVSSQDGKPTKRSYPIGYSTAFHRKAAKLQGDLFQPFTISASGVTKTFKTEKDMMRERDALLDAADEGRLIRD